MKIMFVTLAFDCNLTRQAVKPSRPCWAIPSESLQENSLKSVLLTYDLDVPSLKIMFAGKIENLPHQLVPWPICICLSTSCPGPSISIEAKCERFGLQATGTRQ